MIESYLPIFGATFAGILFGAFMLKLHEWFGPKRPTVEKLTTYESGMIPFHTARQRFTIKFYLVAMLFIIFDIEIVFMYPWAAEFRHLGAQGYIAMVLFMILLFVGFVYVVQKRALEWD